MRLRYRGTLSLMAIGAILLGAAPSVQGTEPRPSQARSSVRDPQDTDGKLDLVFASIKGLGEGRAKLTVRTAERWGCDYLGREPTGGAEDGDWASLHWRFDRNNDGNGERWGTFRCTEDGLELELNSVQSYETQRPDRRSVSVKLPLDKLRLNRRSLHLWAQSMVNGYWQGHVLFEEFDGITVLEP